MAGFASTSLGGIGKIGGVAPGLPKPPKIGQPLKVAGASVGKVGTGGLTYAGAPASVAAKVPKPPKATGAPKPTANPDAAPAAAATPAPAPSSGGSSAVPPLDPTAIANIAAYITKTNNSVNALGSVTTNPDGTLSGFGGTAGNDQNTYQANLAALKQANPLADLKAMTTNNARGGLYSSSYGQQLGNINQGYQTKEGTLGTNLQSALGAIAAKIAALQGGIPLDEAKEAAASAGRLAGLAAATPVPAPAPVPVNAAPAVSSPALPSVAASPGQPIVNTRATAKAAKSKPGKQQAGFRVVG